MVNDYASLQTSIANWLARADLTSAIPDFIALAEARINRDLKDRRMMKVVAGTSAAGLIAIPADSTGIISVRVDYASGDYELRPIAVGRQPVYTINGGLPAGYAVVGTNIVLSGGQQDLAYTLTYWKKLDSIVSTQNWVILNEPGLYLYGALVEASPYIQDDERTVLWATQYKAIADSVNKVDMDNRYGNAPSMTLGFYAP